MSELAPRITYSPEGILELRKIYPDVSERDTLFDPRELLSCMPGYEVSEIDGETILKVEVEEVVSPDPLTADAQKLIYNVARYIYFDYLDPRDGVFSLDAWGEHGAAGVIYSHFQRWLNMGGLTEEVAKTAIKAMAYPLGPEAAKQARKEFRYHTSDGSAYAGIGGYTFGISSKREVFGFYNEYTVDGKPAYKRGSVSWNWLDLSTIGSCACWGPTGEDRQNLHISADSQRLYGMGPHNVDGSAQSLSLVLGAATLAHYASQYEGREDIFAEAVLTDTRYA